MPISRSLTKVWRKVVRPSKFRLHGQRIDVASTHIDAALRRYLRRGRYELHKVRQLRNKIEPNDVFLDVGAGIGLTSLYAASMVGPESVIALEADPRAVELAKINFALNDQPIEIISAAAVANGSPAQVDFYINDELGRSSLTPRAGGVNATSVPTVDIAALVRERRVSALNIDAEGSEYDLLTAIDHFADVRVILLRINEQVIGYEKSIDLIRRLFDAGFALDFPYSRGRLIALARYRF